MMNDGRHQLERGWDGSTVTCRQKVEVVNGSFAAGTVDVCEVGT